MYNNSISQHGRDKVYIQPLQIITTRESAYKRFHRAIHSVYGRRVSGKIPLVMKQGQAGEIGFCLQFQFHVNVPVVCRGKHICNKVGRVVIEPGRIVLPGVDTWSY